MSVIIIRRRRGEGEANGLAEQITSAPGEVSHGQDEAVRTSAFAAVTNLNSWIDQLGGTSSGVNSQASTPVVLASVAERYGDVADLITSETDPGDVEAIETLFEEIRADLYGHSVDIYGAS